MKTCTQTLLLSASLLISFGSAVDSIQAQTPISEEKKRRLGNFDPGNIFADSAGASRKKEAARLDPKPAPVRSRSTKGGRHRELVAVAAPQPTPEPIPTATPSPLAPARAEAAPATIATASAPITAPARLADNLSASTGIQSSGTKSNGNKLSLILASLLAASCTLVVMVVKLIKLKSEPS
jgi:hypothetical protein